MNSPSDLTERLKGCPFCGGEASVSTYRTESLWSHDEVTYTQIGCGECDFHIATEPGYEIEAPEAWNRRSPDPEASSTIEELTRALEEAAALFREYEALHEAKLRPDITATERAEIESKVRRNRIAAEACEARTALSFKDKTDG